MITSFSLSLSHRLHSLPAVGNMKRRSRVPRGWSPGSYYSSDTVTHINVKRRLQCWFLWLNCSFSWSQVEVEGNALCANETLVHSATSTCSILDHTHKREYLTCLYKSRGPPGPDFWVAALWAYLTSSFALFGRSGCVTHTEIWRTLVNPVILTPVDLR